MLDTNKFGEIVGQPAIDGFDIGAKEFLAHRAIATGDFSSGGRLRFGARVFRWQMHQHFRADAPLPRKILGIPPIVASHRDFAAAPIHHRLARQAGLLKNIAAQSAFCDCHCSIP
jgi:hypothetical protein